MAISASLLSVGKITITFSSLADHNEQHEMIFAVANILIDTLKFRGVPDAFFPTGSGTE